MTQALEDFRALISAAQDCVDKLIIAGGGGLSVILLQDVQRVLDEIVTDIDNRILKSRAATIRKIIDGLGGSSEKLKKVHASVEQFKAGLGVSQKIFTAFGSFVQKVSAQG